MTAREAAYLVLRQVEAEGAYANLCLKQFLSQHPLSAQDARLTAELVYGSVRLRLALDHILSQLLTRPIDQLMPEAHTALNLSLYQLRYLNNVQAYAVVDEGVELTRRYANPALAKMTNGILRSYLRQTEKSWLPGRDDMRAYLHYTLSYPEWLVDYLLQRFGPEQAEAFCLAGNSHPGIWLRANTLKTNRDTLLADLTATGCRAEAAGFAPETVLLHGGAISRSPLLKEGFCQVQGAASQLAAHALNPQPGSRVLDLAAAPGGKTTHLAALMNNQGELHAFDIHPHKIPLIQDNCRRVGVTIVQAQAADSTALPPVYQNWADFILLDAPCSGLGVLTERADSRYHKKRSDIRELAKLSGRLLEAAAGYLKPGGRLCYSTCTVTKEENDLNVERFLLRHPEFKPEPLSTLIPWLERPADRAAAQAGRIQFLPFEQGGEGFFIALMRKQL